jgi:hypothetical protein
MFPFWIILGSLLILMGILDRHVQRLLGLRPMSEVFTTPDLKRSSRTIERISRWFVILIGISFLVQGLGTLLPGNVGNGLSFLLLGLAGVLLLAIFAVAILKR